GELNDASPALSRPASPRSPSRSLLPSTSSAIWKGPAEAEENAQARKSEGREIEAEGGWAGASPIPVPLRVFAPSRFRVLFGPFRIGLVDRSWEEEIFSPKPNT